MHKKQPMKLDQTNEGSEGTGGDTAADEAARLAAEQAEALAAIEAKKAAGEALSEEEQATFDAAEAAKVASADEETQVTFGDQAPDDNTADDAAAPQWVRDLRKSHRETVAEKRAIERRAKELEQQLEQLKNPAPTTVGKKPELSDFEYDETAYAEALLKWHEDSRKVEEMKQRAKDLEAEQEREWQQKLLAYNESKKTIQSKDFAEAEATVLASLSEAQQGILLHGVEKSALLVLALGKNPAELDKLAAIKDPIRFAFAASKLEDKMKVTTPAKRQAPPPEKIPTGSGSASAGSDSALEKLRAEAAKTGDYSKVIAHKAKLRAADKK